MITARTKLLGVVGNPVRHSLSPVIHNAWIAAAGLDGAYLAFEPPLDGFETLVEGLKGSAIGVNVTMPFKEEAYAISDSREAVGPGLQAANVLKFEDGRVLAHNTDGEGLCDLLEAKGWTDGPVVVLGAGGAASAVVEACRARDCPDIRVVNRHRDRAQRLADADPDTIFPFGWDEMGAALKDAAAVVNATPLGMAGRPPLELDLNPAPAGAIVADMVYHPLRTPLLDQAVRRGHPAIDGLDMLIAQGRLSFAIFFGQAPPAEVDVRALCLAELERRG